MTSPAWTGPVDPPPVGPTPLVGDVIEFDEPRGLGLVEYGPGRRLGFHCTAITDGSRTIAVGTVVAFIVSAGRLGRLEARSVRPLPGVVPPGSTLEPAAVRADLTQAVVLHPEGGSVLGGPGGAGPSSPEGGDPAPSAVSDRTPPSGTRGVGSAEPGAPGDQGSPRPDFLSPLARPSGGPPPTWSTPATPSSPPPGSD